MYAQLKELPTQPIEGQKTGTSGLRKKTKVNLQEICSCSHWGSGFRDYLLQGLLSQRCMHLRV